MNKENLEKITELRHILHSEAELSGRERNPDLFRILCKSSRARDFLRCLAPSNPFDFMKKVEKSCRGDNPAGAVRGTATMPKDFYPYTPPINHPLIFPLYFLTLQGWPCCPCGSL